MRPRAGAGPPPSGRTGAGIARTMAPWWPMIGSSRPRRLANTTAEAGMRPVASETCTPRRPPRRSPPPAAPRAACRGPPASRRCRGPASGSGTRARAGWAGDGPSRARRPGERRRLDAREPRQPRQVGLHGTAPARQQLGHRGADRSPPGRSRSPAARSRPASSTFGQPVQQPADLRRARPDRRPAPARGSNERSFASPSSRPGGHVREVRADHGVGRVADGRAGRPRGSSSGRRRRGPRRSPAPDRAPRG